jgi:D-3-phosphoglycerate dehydrogenase / 2-oxoglutarate reductase
MKIVIADPLPSSAVDVLRDVPGWTVDAPATWTPEALRQTLADADALLVRSATRVDTALLSGAPRLKVVARAGSGIDNVDLDAASARGILVLNAPGANSVSVAEHACALMLALARPIARADTTMKAGRWEKKGLLGTELRGKVLGLVGLGRVGQEVAARARAFGMEVVAHDPFISAQVAADLGLTLLPLDELCGRCDYISLHAPASAATRHLFDRARLARCKAGARIVNTARGELIDESALADAIESGHIAGAGLDVFETEPPAGARLVALPQVVATPHIAASTHEAQELVGVETAASVRDYLRDGTVRNPVNFPSLPAEEFTRLRPSARLAERLGGLIAQLADGRIHAIGLRYYGNLATDSHGLLASAALAGLFRVILSEPVTPVNARAVAAQRGIELIESRSSRPRPFTNLLSVKLHTSAGERWVEGAVFEDGRPRLVLVDGVPVEAPLEGELVVIRNADQPGVIGEVGTVLGAAGVNIGSFSLGRDAGGAVGVISVDRREGSRPPVEGAVLDRVRALRGIRDARLVRIPE